MDRTTSGDRVDAGWHPTGGDTSPIVGENGPGVSGAGPDSATAGVHQAGAEPWQAARGAAGAQDRPTWGDPASAGSATKNRSWKKTVGAVAVAAVVVAGGVVGVDAMASGAENTATGQRGGPGGMGGFGGEGQSAFPGGAMPGQNGGQGRQGAGQFGLGSALHGDFVVSSGSSFETRRMERGKITAMSGGTVSLTSDDGYSSDYAVGDVDVSSLAVGDTVVAIATVSGDAATLTSLVSETSVSSGTGQQGGMGPQSGTDPQQGGTGPQSGTSPQSGTDSQGGTGPQSGTGGQQDGRTVPDDVGDDRGGLTRSATGSPPYGWADGAAAGPG